jgi:DNA invertase Pin-like site-specific DNA recombinase
MAALLIGGDNARCSTDQQDLTAQRDGLTRLGVAAERIYVDHGLTGTDRERPGLREALAACRAGDTLVVTKLDRLARSLPDARAIADELTARQVSLNLGGSVYDPTDAVGRLLFNVLAMVAECDLIRLRTREGMKVAKSKGRLRGKQPKLNRQEAHPLDPFPLTSRRMRFLFCNPELPPLDEPIPLRCGRIVGEARDVRSITDALT